MKRLLLALMAVLMSAGAFAEEAADKEEKEEKEQHGRWHISAISPYAGIISGVDVKFDKMYVGIGKNIMSGAHSKQPKFVVKEGYGSNVWDYSPMIKTKTDESFRISLGHAEEKAAFGLHMAFGRITPDLPGRGSASSLGAGIEGAWHFWGGLFVKGSLTYFFGAKDFDKYSFYDSGTVSGISPHLTLTYKKDDKVSIGSDWKLGIALGYRFNL